MYSRPTARPVAPEPDDIFLTPPILLPRRGGVELPPSWLEEEQPFPIGKLPERDAPSAAAGAPTASRQAASLADRAGMRGDAPDAGPVVMDGAAQPRRMGDEVLAPPAGGARSLPAWRIIGDPRTQYAAPSALYRRAYEEVSIFLAANGVERPDAGDIYFEQAVGDLPFNGRNDLSFRFWVVDRGTPEYGRLIEVDFYRESGKPGVSPFIRPSIKRQALTPRRMDSQARELMVKAYRVLEAGPWLPPEEALPRINSRLTDVARFSLSAWPSNRAGEGPVNLRYVFFRPGGKRSLETGAIAAREGEDPRPRSRIPPRVVAKKSSDSARPWLILIVAVVGVLAVLAALALALVPVEFFGVLKHQRSGSVLTLVSALALLAMVAGPPEPKQLQLPFPALEELPPRDITDMDIWAAADELIANFKNSGTSETEYNMEVSNRAAGLARRGASEGQVALFKSLCDQGVIQGGHFSSFDSN